MNILQVFCFHVVTKSQITADVIKSHMVAVAPSNNQILCGTNFRLKCLIIKNNGMESFLWTKLRKLHLFFIIILCIVFRMLIVWKLIQHSKQYFLLFFCLPVIYFVAATCVLNYFRCSYIKTSTYSGNESLNFGFCCF